MRSSDVGSSILEIVQHSLILNCSWRPRNLYFSASRDGSRSAPRSPFSSPSRCRQILLALALAALLLSGGRLRLPRIWLPLGLVPAGHTDLAGLSPDPAAGLPQVRKIFVFTTLLVVYSTLRDMVIIRRLFLVGRAPAHSPRCAASCSSATRCRRRTRRAQLLRLLRRRAHHRFHQPLDDLRRQEMFALLMATAFLFFACVARKRAWLWLLCALPDGHRAAAGLHAQHLAGQRRRGLSICSGSGSAAGGGAARGLLLLIALLAPASIRERFSSCRTRQDRFQPAPHRHLAHRPRNDPRASLVRHGPRRGQTAIQ